MSWYKQKNRTLFPKSNLSFFKALEKRYIPSGVPFLDGVRKLDQPFLISGFSKLYRGGVRRDRERSGAVEDGQIGRIDR